MVSKKIPRRRGTAEKDLRRKEGAEGTLQRKENHRSKKVRLFENGQKETPP